MSVGQPLKNGFAKRFPTIEGQASTVTD